MHYVLAIGSYDSCFVGPFDSATDAEGFADRQKSAKPQFDFYPMTEADMRANIAQYGDCPIVAPGAYC